MKVPLGGLPREGVQRLLELARDTGALRYGNFTLSSGQKTTYYFDGRLLTLDPEGASIIGRLVLELSRQAGADVIGGPTIGADPIVGAVLVTSQIQGTGIRGFIVRKEVKGHGTGQLIEGHLKKGDCVAIVDDTCTTGGSLIHAISAAEEAGGRVVKVMVIVDRHQGGSEEINRRGYAFTSLIETAPDGQLHASGI